MDNSLVPIQVLVVDDEENIRDGSERTLKPIGFEVFKASRGSEALDILSQNEISIVLLDLKMPGMDGMEVLLRIQDINPSILVIVITGFATVQTAIEAMKQGCQPAPSVAAPRDGAKVPFQAHRSQPHVDNCQPDNHRMIETKGREQGGEYQSWVRQPGHSSRLAPVHMQPICCHQTKDRECDKHHRAKLLGRKLAGRVKSNPERNDAATIDR